MSRFSLSPCRIGLLALCVLFVAGAGLHAQPGVPTLSQPANNATGIPTTASFLWRPVSGGATYEIELAFDAGFQDPAYQNRIAEYQVEVADLWPDTLYYWRVRAVDTLDSTSAWAGPWSFRTVVTGAPRPVSPADGAPNVPYDQVVLNFSYPTVPPNGFEAAYAFDPSFRGGVVIATSAQSAGVPTLPPDTTIYWRVRVAGGAAAGPGAWSRTVQFRTASAPLPQLGLCTPIAPTNGVTLEDLLISSIWSGPPAGAAPVRYHVQFSLDPTMRDVAMNFEGLDSTSLRVRLPEGSAAWYWRVQAVATNDAVLDGPWSSVATFSIRERVGTALDAPLLQLPPDRSHNRGASVAMMWDSVAGAAGYEMELGRDTLFDASDTVISTLRRSTSVRGLQLDTLYIWRVRALSDSGVGPWSLPFTFSTRAVDTVLPGTPTLVAPDNEMREPEPIVVFRWTRASDATAHVVQVSGDSTFAEGGDEFGAFDTTVTVQLEAGRRWWWRVRGVNEFGPGPWSSVRTFTTAAVSAAVPGVEEGRLRSIAITPTPALSSAHVTARLAPFAGARVTVASLRGEVVFEGSFRAEEEGRLSLDLPVDRLAPGVYRCRIVSDGGAILETPLVVAR